MRESLAWLLPGATLLLLALAVVAFLLYRRLTSSIDAEVQQGTPTAAPDDPTPPTAAEGSAVAQRLLDAGLNREPVLGDTAVSGHLRRLEAGEVGGKTLLRYADDLARLNRFTAEEGGPVPTDFWDVRTEVMEANGWDEYGIVRNLSGPAREPYLRLLARGYGRFLLFKAGEEAGEDTALDAALDLFAYVEAYYESVPFAALTEHAEGIEGEAEEVLLIWQSLVAGTTRVNPLTGSPMFSHSIYARDNVGTIYQYDQDRALSIAEVWGVTGFAPRFVGIPGNNNQVEHMSISMVLQILLGDPVLVLDAIEEERVLAGHADKAEADADMALNNAIHSEFAPLYREDRQRAVERLRCFPRGEC